MWPGFLRGDDYECHMGAIRMTKHDLIPSESFRYLYLLGF